ncbi:MAG: J domain-containing protein [Erythrobacter sp.]|nr:J domain-containing protein [Erythrobacter sp.]
MLRYLVLIAAASLLCRWILGKWPWDYLRATSPRVAALRRARSLLGVAPEASREEVIAAHRRLVGLVHPDRGGSKEAMQEANAARDLLLAELPAPAGGESD